MTNTPMLTRLIALASLVAVSNGAFAEAETPHYQGFSRDKSSEFRLYLNGGEFLQRKASLHSVRLVAHQLRKGQTLRRLQGCVYHFDDADRSRDRIECAEDKTSPLGGVHYARAPKGPSGN
ncbi:MAG: hypothetical protein V4772_26725, partial [Pseudomonadota bacterium]